MCCRRFTGLLPIIVVVACIVQIELCSEFFAPLAIMENVHVVKIDVVLIIIGNVSGLHLQAI